MDLYIKVATVRAGTSDPVLAQLERCPPGVDAATVRSYLARKFGEPLRLAWASTSGHPRGIGWVFPGGPAAGTDTAHEILCIPALLAPDGTLQDLFERQADCHHVTRQPGATLHGCPPSAPACRCAPLPGTGDARGSPGRSSAARGMPNPANHRTRPGSGRRRVLRPRDHVRRMDLHSASRPC